MVSFARPLGVSEALQKRGHPAVQHRQGLGRQGDGEEPAAGDRHARERRASHYGDLILPRRDRHYRVQDPLEAEERDAVKAVYQLRVK